MILNDRIRPICLPQTISPVVGEQCSITGWGYKGKSESEPPPYDFATNTCNVTGPENARGASLSFELQQAYVPIYDFGKCLKLGEDYKTNLSAKEHMCAGNATTAATDSCTVSIKTHVDMPSMWLQVIVDISYTNKTGQCQGKKRKKMN